MNPDEAVLLWVDEYSRMADAYDTSVVPRFTPFAARLVAEAGLREHATVLDVSTGTGLTALLAAKAVAGTGLVVGIDLADGALAVAQTKAARAGLRNLRFEMLDSRNIVYRSATFDAVLSSFGLPSIGHAQVLREIGRVLKDGSAFRLVEWAARDPPSGWDAWDEVLREHRTSAPSATLAQLRDAGDLVMRSGDYEAIRDPAGLAAKMKEAGFSSVRTTPHAESVDFASVDELFAFRGSFGPTERELAEMDDASREAFRRDVEARFEEYRHEGVIRLRWSVVYYEATK
ncbi:MAG TPA: methyltransferase domain-containing protein [Thermoplasmata archaeon]|nr:methyltransferase domain-containing protein [Thermoplasmata archaeon]